jgi:predicted RND superfamily exporter protein
MRLLYKHPAVVLVVLAVITLFFGLQLPRSDFDNDALRFVPVSDSARQESEYIDDTFGSSLVLLVALENTNETDFEADFLNKIREFVDQVKEIEVVDANKVISIVNADYITADGDSIVVEELVPSDFSGTADEIIELKRRIRSWDLYRNALISDDFTATQILVPLNLYDDNNRSGQIAQYMTIRTLAHTMFDDIANVYVTGMPVITASLTEYVKKDLMLLIPLVIIIVLAVLFFFFRRPGAVIITLIAVAIATIWTMGAMPIFGMKLTMLSSALPIILIAVGSAYGIIVMTFYLSDIQNKSGLSRAEHSELVIELMKKVWKSVFLAAFTTLAGFSSFCFTSVVPIFEWGIFACFGVLAAFIAALTFIPCVLILRGPKRMITLGKEKSGLHDTAQAGFTDFLLAATKKKYFVVGAVVAVAIIACVSVSGLVIDNIFVEYFDDSTEIVRSDKFIRQKFGGSKIINLVVSAETPEILLSPKTLSAMDGLENYLYSHNNGTGKILAFTDLIKRINQVINADESPDGLPMSSYKENEDTSLDDFGFGFGSSSSNSVVNNAGSTPSENPILSKQYSVGEFMLLLNRALSNGNSNNLNSDELFTSLKKIVNYEGASYYEIPSDPKRYGKVNEEELQRIISNYLALISSSISAYANDPLEPTEIKMSLQLRTVGAEDTAVIINDMKKYIDRNFPANVKTTIAGPAIVEASLTNLVIDSQLISLFVSLLIVFIILAISNKSFVAGLIGLIPLALSILVNFAIMSALGIKLNIGTSLVAGLTVGIGIDYTIHIMETYKYEYKSGRSDYLRSTFSSVGLAIIINAVSVGLGFAALTLSQFTVIRNFGLLVAQTMGVAALVALILVPVLLEWIKPKFITK